MLVFFALLSGVRLFKFAGWLESLGIFDFVFAVDQASLIEFWCNGNERTLGGSENVLKVVYKSPCLVRE